MNIRLMAELWNARYRMELRGGGDVWRLEGKAYGHPRIPDGDIVHPSSPVALQDDVLTTASGQQYRIMSYENRDKVVEQINQDIKNGGYEVH